MQMNLSLVAISTTTHALEWIEHAHFLTVYLMVQNDLNTHKTLWSLRYTLVDAEENHCHNLYKTIFGVGFAQVDNSKFFGFWLPALNKWAANLTSAASAMHANAFLTTTIVLTPNKIFKHGINS